MDLLHLIRLKDIPILQQLQIEEALLRADGRNWCLTNVGAPPAIVMGISCKYHDHINELKMQEKPIPVIRRFSGGGTVVIDEQTHFFTLIGGHSLLNDHLSSCVFPEDLFRWTEKIYAPAFEGIDFSLHENDFVIGKRKFGGNAQYFCRQRWLHHSSFLWDYKQTMMDYLLMPKKFPKYRQGRTHADFLCRLNAHFSHAKHFEKKMIDALSRYFSVKEMSLRDLDDILSKEHRRSTIQIC